MVGIEIQTQGSGLRIDWNSQPELPAEDLEVLRELGGSREARLVAGSNIRGIDHSTTD